MEIKYQYQEKRKQKAMAFWLKVAEEFNSGIPAQKIAKRYTNPLTGKPYSASNIYYILNQLKKAKHFH